MITASSVNRVSIRLTHERWYHIVENHDDLAGYFYEVLETIETPGFIVRGSNGALKAVRNMGDMWLVVVYKEISKRDGFVITAYLLDKRPKREIIWRRH